VLEDESGFMLTPNVKYTWAPKGKTPHVFHWFKQDKVSAVGALSISPIRKRIRLFLRFKSRNITSKHIVQFLQYLLRHLQGHVFLVWDGSTIHRSKKVTEFLHRHPRIHTFRFPPYAPELNPIEFFWSQIDSDLANGRPADLGQLSYQLHKSTRKKRSSQKMLRSCLHRSGLFR
jgi:transposase